jgi:uncharacterized membrane protein
MPVAVLGLAFFLAMTALSLPAAWRLRRLDAVRVGGAVLGVVGVLYLVWAELFRVRAICLWCTGVHALALGLLISVLWSVADRDPAAG